MQRYIGILMPLLLLLSVAVEAQNNSINLSAGLVNYYSFSQQSYLSLIAERPAVLSNGAEWAKNRFGDDNSSISIDGVAQNLRIPNGVGTNISGGSGYSVSLWIKPRDNNQGCILLKEGDYGLKWNGMDKPLTVFDGLKSGFPTGFFADWSSSEWYHITLVRDDNNNVLSLYVDGRLDRSWEVQDKEIPVGKDLFLGKHPYFWGGYTGMIDDLALYNRPLNQFEILTLSQIENIPLESDSPQAETQFELRDFLGTWQGVITQPDNSLIPNYGFWLHFTKIEDGILKGYSRIEVPENDAFGVTMIQGIISGNRLNFEEIRIHRQKNYLGYKWCKKYGQLSFDPVAKSVLGDWYANNCMEVGKLLLYETDNPFNYHDNRLSQTISLEDIICQLEENDKKSDSTNPPTLPQRPIKVNMETIHFGFGTASLTKQSREYLKGKLVPVLAESTTLKLRITGFTDSSGSDLINLELSTQRAKAIYDFLIAQKISHQQLEYIGLGEANPIAPNTTLEGRRANRRVEFELIPIAG